MTAIILEDEQMAASRLKRMLNDIANDIKITAIFETIEDTTKHMIAHGQPDLIFMDIHVADGNSFELFKVLNVKSKVIFTTAYNQYAIDAFRENAIDYLLKPLKKELLIEAISKAKPINSNPSIIDGYKNRFLIKFGNKLNSLKTTDIAYIYSKSKISYFYTFEGQRFPSDYKLQELENLLNPSSFFRANRQFIVHLESIKSMKRHQASRVKLSLKPQIDEEIIVSTNKTKKFKEWVER